MFSVEFVPLLPPVPIDFLYELIPVRLGLNVAKVLDNLLDGLELFCIWADKSIVWHFTYDTVVNGLGISLFLSYRFDESERSFERLFELAKVFL